MPAGPHFVAQPILLSENIPNIVQSSAKHRRSDEVDDKTTIQTTYVTEGILPMKQVAILKIFDQVRKIWTVNCLFDIKRHNVSLYL